jgi:hypothetical protein
MVNMRDLSRQAVASLLKDVQNLLDLGQRACCDDHRLFNVFKDQDVDQRIVLDDSTDCVYVRDGSCRSFQVSPRRHVGLIWLNIELCRPISTAMHADASSFRNLIHLRLGHRGNSATNQLQRSRVMSFEFQSNDTSPFCETCAICKSVVLDI